MDILLLSGVRQGCVVAPDLFLNPMDWLLERTVHRGMVGTSISSESFSDLDFANDVALLAEMLSLLVLALEIMDEKRDHSVSPSTGQRPRFRQCLTPHPRATRLQYGHSVEVVESFPYLGSLIHCRAYWLQRSRNQVQSLNHTRHVNGSGSQHLTLPHLRRYQIAPL